MEQKQKNKKIFSVEYTTTHPEEEYKDDNKREAAEQNNFYDMLWKIEQVIKRRPETVFVKGGDGHGEWEWNGITDQHGDRAWLYHNTTYFLLTEEEANKLKESGFNIKVVE